MESVITPSSGQPVRTASSDRSIWNDLPEDEFRLHLVSLEKLTNAVPVDVQRFEPQPSADDDTLRLPITVEQQLADDFAFLAAVKEGAQSVAAACLEQHLAPLSKLKIRIAAADTIDRSVQTTLKAVCEVLIRVGMRDASHDFEPENEIFQLVVAQHQYRVLARLRSSKWQKPKYLSASHKKPLWQDFANLTHRVQHLYPTKKQRRQRTIIENHLLALAACYEQFEEATDQGIHRRLAILIKSTYEFCKYEEVQTYGAALVSLRPTAQISAAIKCLHQLEKVGAYWRIAVSLVKTARQYHHIFFDVELEYLNPYESLPTSVGYETWAKSCHVHAEIQLVVDYDLQRQVQKDSESGSEEVLWPRVIGSSKYMCYLCYLFVKYHGRFFAANTHGRLYDQWTVPDLQEYNDQTRLKYARVLGIIDETVRTQMAQEPHWRAEPMTSRQNLLLIEDVVESEKAQSRN